MSTESRSIGLLLQPTTNKCQTNYSNDKARGLISNDICHEEILTLHVGQKIPVRGRPWRPHVYANDPSIFFHSSSLRFVSFPPIHWFCANILLAWMHTMFVAISHMNFTHGLTSQLQYFNDQNHIPHKYTTNSYNKLNLIKRFEPHGSILWPSWPLSNCQSQSLSILNVATMRICMIL